MPNLGTLQLRDYQVEALSAVASALDSGTRALTLQMATGTGKSLVAAHIVRDLVASRGARRVLYLVDRLELQNQMLDLFLRAEMPSGEPLPSAVRLDRDASVLRFHHVHISTIQRVRTLVAAEGLAFVAGYDAIVLDDVRGTAEFLNGFEGLEGLDGRSREV